ncbi:MAG: class I SAM-dependent methyltransferase [Verrucomicrobiales bacterium]|nr:class I SAM-dependent methyltransferase [Verrucomicrobiales bacterium]
MNPSFADHFSSVARTYAEFRPKYPAALFDFLASRVPREAAVWDCAAGNGQATLDLAARFARVYGTDASAEQIASAPAVPSIEWRVAPADHSGLPDASVGLVTVAQAIHWFPFDRFYAEVRRVLQPGGLLAVWAYGACSVAAPAMQDLITEYYDGIVGAFWPPERRFVEEGYRTIPFPWVETRCPDLTMEADWNLDELLGYFGTWSATNRYRKATGLNPLEPLRDSLLPHWGDPSQTRRILWPLALRVGRLE